MESLIKDNRFKEKNSHLRPDYLFEISWEVCNKVGGIHTVIASKTLTIVREWEDQYILIGPDIWKGSGEHPEFREDPDLFKTWKEKVDEKGVKIRAGRWKIAGNPLVILVDYTSLFPIRNEIFENLWLDYKVDSLGAGWDYIEPALFGYAAGMVIESFYQCHLTLSDQIVANFHEWLTAAGVLYVEKTVPQIATVFTTHATVLGRALAGNDLPFYTNFKNFNLNLEAKKWNVTSKYSLEKAGAHYADCFTTVSEMTAKECRQFLQKEPDVITINGFDDTIVPVSYQLKQKRIKARKKLIKVANALTGGEIDNDCLLLLKSGRYEFRNKGIDIFIESLAGLREKGSLKKNVIGFIFVPVHHTGPNKELKDAIEGKFTGNGSAERLITHHLQGRDSDKIVQHLIKMNFENNPGDRVKIIFAPVYLDGRDGIFDLTYYDLLPGFDLSIFPSYYEPWGYTPLESIAFHVPSVTSDVAGFGQYMQTFNKGIYVVHREDKNNTEVVREIVQIIMKLLEYPDMTEIREVAYELSKNATWGTLFENYRISFSFALAKTRERKHLFVHQSSVTPIKRDKAIKVIPNGPVWRKIYVKPELPVRLKDLEELTGNLWWSWNQNATSLLSKIDVGLWRKSGGNPITVLKEVSYDRIECLAEDEIFQKELEVVMSDFRSYMARPCEDNLCVGYFCMEFGLEKNFKNYSGGLGILAGDYLKEASDLGRNLIGVGLLFRKGYFKQKISLHGDQVCEDDLQKFTQLPLEPVRDDEGEWIMINMGLPGRTLFAKAWRVPVGRTSLFLLDTDIPENRTEDRIITSQLYTSQKDMRLKQELLLGIGGVRLLNALKINPDVYHCNEGHAAFMGIERIYREIMEDNLPYKEALELIRASTLFTSHTTVNAGDDNYEEDLIRTYLAHYTEVLNISWDELMGLGRSETGNKQESFSMGNLAARIAQELNAVSLVNEGESKKKFHQLWKGFTLEELPFGHVTNAVHINTWTSQEWQVLFIEKLGLNSNNGNRNEVWLKIDDIEDSILWDTHRMAKEKLVQRIREKLKLDILVHHEARKALLDTLEIIRDEFLLIGFARRFVTYKRPTLLFHNLDRLSTILNNTKRPVIVLFAGKAHPADEEGQQLLKQVISHCYNSKVQGKIIFLEDYNIEIAKEMVQGVDLWLNTPERGMEASGTSGMKALYNGVLNFSSLDGWWKEAYDANYGWAIPENVFEDSRHINEFDASEIYRILEAEIIPAFYDRKDGLPLKWIRRMKSMMIHLAPEYTTKRMLEDYFQKYYYKLYDRSKLLKQDEFERLRDLIRWKKRVYEQWPKLEIKRLEINKSTSKPIALGNDFIVEVEIFLNGLKPNEVSLEILLFEKREDEIPKNLYLIRELDMVSWYEDTMICKCEIKMTLPGVYYHSLRIRPKNSLLSNNCEFPVITYF